MGALQDELVGKGVRATYSIEILLASVLVPEGLAKIRSAPKEHDQRRMGPEWAARAKSREGKV